MAYDAASGATVWTRKVFTGPHGLNHPTAIVVSPDGSKVFVTGELAKQADDYGTVAYAASTGVRLWTATYRAPAGSSGATSIAVSPDSSTVFVTGGTNLPNPTPPTVVQATVAYQS